MQSKQYFTKIKNYPHEKSTEPKFSNRARFDSSRKRTKKQPSNINLFNGCFFVAGPGIEPGTS